MYINFLFLILIKQYIKINYKFIQKIKSKFISGLKFIKKINMKNLYKKQMLKLPYILPAQIKHTNLSQEFLNKIKIYKKSKYKI